MLGYGKDEMNGTPTRNNFVSDEAYHALGMAAYPILNNGGIYRTQLEHLRHDGRVLTVDMSGAMLNPATGESLWAFIDITERCIAEEKLRYSEQRFRDVSEAAGEYLWEIDTNLVYTYVSSRAAEVKGYRPEELLGHTPMEFMPEEDIAAVGEIVNQAVANHAPFRLQHRDISKTGTVVWEEVNGVPIYDKDGKVIGLRGTGLNISERKEMESQVHQLAFYDTLTKLPNRRLLDERLSQALAASRRSGRYGALMFLDLDNFKPLNDTYGHAVGDLLLIEAANRIKNCVREIDTVARFGGDEFVVLLNDLNADRAESVLQAEQIAEKIRTSLSDPYLLPANQREQTHTTVTHHSSATIGVALFLDHEGIQNDILRWADAAMYQAKESGRNLIRIYEP
jgi:diguanylate cyclase (GGDEF)-like protein/PAS domain S-box-containing protein